MLRNLIHSLRSYKTASIFNILGLCLGFFFFIVVVFHYQYENDFDSNINTNIYQLENLRDDGTWDANFSRPMLETLANSSALIQNYGISQQLAYNEAAKIGFSAEQDALTKICTIELASPEYFTLLNFDFVQGNPESLEQPFGVAIPFSLAKSLFGNENAVGKPLYLPEFKGLGANSGLPIPTDITPIVAAVYKDFPENTRLTNSVYLSIPKFLESDNWRTCNFYCLARLESSEDAARFVSETNREYANLMHSHAVQEIRLRPVHSLYFGEGARNDASPRGNKTLNDVLLFIGLLIIIIALANYINFSIAISPQRAKGVTMRKVLGSSTSLLRKGIVLESVLVVGFAFIVSLGLFFALKDEVSSVIGHKIEVTRYWTSILWVAATAIIGGILSGVYPAIFTTSFPAAKALNGSFMLDKGSKFLRKAIIGLQFFISIALVSLSIFVVLQNRYLSNYELGFDKENILEVKLSMGTALTKSDLFRSELLKDASIKEVAFCQTQFVHDGLRPLIGYSFNGHHSYISWTGVSPQLPEMFDVQLLEGRFFNESESSPVCIINETAAKELSEYGEQILNSHIMDNGIPVEIIGIMKDINYESLYKSMTPLAFWCAAPGTYRSMAPGNFAYVKIVGSNPRHTINHIYAVADKLNPSYPTEVRFLDDSLNSLYEKSRTQGILVATLSIIAVLLSLIGVFAMSIFEAKRLKKDIAVRKVWGADVVEILSLFTKPIIINILIAAVISVPLSVYGINIWLNGFAYHIGLYPWVFLLAVTLVLIIAVGTVTYQNYKIANSNPKDSL